jgi:hypothetical protein
VSGGPQLRYTHEPEALKRVWETMVLGAGARLLHARTRIACSKPSPPGASPTA